MNTVSKQVVPAPVLGLCRRFEQWRRSRPRLGPIPDELWRNAAHLARAHGVSLVARALHLEYYALKRHLDAKRSTPRCACPPRQAFVEVSMTAPSAPEYLVEMERQDGGKMRVRLVDQAGVVALSDSFWRCRP